MIESGKLLLSVVNDSECRLLCESQARYGHRDFHLAVLDFAKADAGRLVLEDVPVDLRTTLRNAEMLVHPTAESKNVLLSIIVASSVPEFVRGDPIRLQQVSISANRPG